MNKLVKVESDSGTILIESTFSEQTGKMVQAGGVSDKIAKKLENLLEVIKPMTDTIVESVNTLQKKPTSISAEFGLSITAEGNIFVGKVSGESSLKITFTWDDNGTD